ncbi:response regulator transcription factor [Clostridium sp. 'deep sea']|uniref:response regulator transcription factor n=1 Tax=Clostridium sp. 'deep sea' TaxID=2779445 RepID=UPI001896691C|nr:response regulator transcription factor [Clostridium sp. 'deep sea']QOR36572.1 response regulator transcription factor [Clostridium sp. 'deep sea']
MSKKVLIAEDDQRMQMLVSDFLIHEGYEVIVASNGKDALVKLKEVKDIKLIVLDVMMPFLNGWQVCQEVRKTSTIPIIMLTAKNTEPDELRGFTKGVDEYITKPFSPSIFVARVNALYSRTYNQKDMVEVAIGDLTINTLKHKVWCKNEVIDLSQTEYSLLLFLLENKGIVLSREQLLNKVWGFDYQGTDRTVDTHINRLRVKLRECGYYIQTVRGYGYKIEVCS